MNLRLILSASVEYKIRNYNSEYYSLEETQKYIAQLIYDAEGILTNPVIGKTYTEENGEFMGISRIVIRGFRIYYEKYNNDIMIVGIKFPREI